MPPTPEHRIPNPEHRTPNPAPCAKRRYTVSDKVRAANRARTPGRVRAGRENLEKAWARQRDPNCLPGGPFVHGLYSRDLRRTAPLAGESAEEYDRWQERLWQSFPPANERQAERLAAIGDRVWRVRRTLASWVHQERLAFYEALFEAAAQPDGLGLEPMWALVEGLAKALDFHLESLLGLEARLGKQQGRLTRAVQRWFPCATV